MLKGYKKKLIKTIDEYISNLPSVRTASDPWYRYEMDTPYGILFIKNDIEVSSEVYSLFCRFQEGKELHPNNPCIGTNTNKYNLHMEYIGDIECNDLMLSSIKRHLTF